VAQAVENLLCKHKPLISNPSSTKKKKKKKKNAEDIAQMVGSTPASKAQQPKFNSQYRKKKNKKNCSLQMWWLFFCPQSSGPHALESVLAPVILSLCPSLPNLPKETTVRMFSIRMLT
jgi:hypothetical protein